MVKQKSVAENIIYSTTKAANLVIECIDDIQWEQKNLKFCYFNWMEAVRHKCKMFLYKLTAFVRAHLRFSINAHMG